MPKGREQFARLKAELGRLRPDTYTTPVEALGGIAYREWHNVQLSDILTANVQGITFQHNDGETSWDSGDPYIDLTVPLRLKRRYTPEAVQESVRQLARYATYNGLHRQDRLQIVGSVTHQSFANYVRRLIGSLVQIADVSNELLPPESVDAALRIHDIAHASQIAERKAVFAYAAVTNIIEPFVGHDPEITAWYDDPPNQAIIGPFDPATGLPKTMIDKPRE